MNQHTRKKYPFHRRAKVGDYEPPSYCPGTFVDSRAYAVHHDNHSIVVNAEIISRCNWEERVAIPPCFVPSFSELLHLYMVVSQLPEGTKCQRLLVSLTSLSASRWRRANFFQYNRKPHLEMAKPWVTKWRGYCVCSKTSHESHQVKPLSAKHVAADQSHADSDNSYYHFLLWPNGNGLPRLLKGATRVAKDTSDGTPPKKD